LSARAKPRESEYSIVRGHLFIRRKEALPFTIKAVGVKRETETSLLVKGRLLEILPCYAPLGRGV